MPSYGEFVTPPPLTPDAPPPNHEICRLLGCPGCVDCRDDDSDATWDGKDDESDTAAISHHLDTTA